MKNERGALYSVVMCRFVRTCAFVLFVLPLATLSAGSTRPRPSANGDPFLRCVGSEVLTDQVCDGLVVRVVGSGTLVTERVVPPVVRRHIKGTHSPQERPAESIKYDTVSMRGFNAATRVVYEVTFSRALLDRIRRAREARGLNDGSETVDDPNAVEGISPRLARRRLARAIELVGLSNATDSRVVLTPTTKYPWRTIASFDNSCTGTLIGPRLLITAAHCLNKSGTMTFYNLTVTPGLDGPTAPYGSSTTLAPGGPTWYWTSTQWQQCTGDAEDCQEYDWGFLVIPKPLGNLTGWMGFAAQPGSILNSLHHLNRGYPGCSGPPGTAIPMNCQASRLYGDTKPCPLGDYYNEDPDDWNRNIEHGCDVSAGESGSPLYHYGLNQKGKKVPIVTMVNIATSCDSPNTDPCDSDDDTPNVARRITPSALGVINWGLQTFP